MQTTEPQSVTAACWSCGASLPTAQPFCPHCGTVQPPLDNVDYFAVFGLSRELNIDLTALERSFYRLSRKLHPDVYAQATPQEQQWSLDQTSLLNDAYRTLKNPIARTEYLLKLEGILLEAGKSDDGTSKESRVPADLLEEVFELNMQLEEMRMNRKVGEDDPTLRSDLEKAKAQFETQLAKIDGDLQVNWELWDGVCDIEDEREQELAKKNMVALLDRRRYVRNLVRDVNEALGN